MAVWGRWFEPLKPPKPESLSPGFWCACHSRVSPVWEAGLHELHPIVWSVLHLPSRPENEQLTVSWGVGGVFCLFALFLYRASIQTKIRTEPLNPKP